MDFDIRGLLRRVVEEVEAEIRQFEKELAEARRVGARAEELSAIRDILYEDKWFRIATAVYAQIKRQSAEDGKAGELLEAAYIKSSNTAHPPEHLYDICRVIPILYFFITISADFKERV
jgi:metal-dependent amidase/aminoacylase/carboxypeptidase family protein